MSNRLRLLAASGITALLLGGASAVGVVMQANKPPAKTATVAEKPARPPKPRVKVIRETKVRYEKAKPAQAPSTPRAQGAPAQVAVRPQPVTAPAPRAPVAAAPPSPTVRPVGQRSSRKNPTTRTSPAGKGGRAREADDRGEREGGGDD